MITVKNLRHRYGARVVVRIDEMEIERGEIVAIVGPSGAGKSTLMRLLALLESPTEGAIEIDIAGQAIIPTSLSIEARRQIVMVFQRPSLLSRSVYDNVAYALRVRGGRDVREKVLHILKQVDMIDLINAKPRQLSGGEMQRVAIARALVLNPSLLVLDEPTANLDPANIRLLERLFIEHNQEHGTTILIVTHNIFQAKRMAQRVGLMIGSELVELSDVDTFFNNPADSRTNAFVSGEFVY